MKKIAFLVLPFFATSLLTSCGCGSSKEFIVTCANKDVILSNTKAIKGQDYISEISINSEMVSMGYTLPNALTKVNSGNREILAHEYTYNLKDSSTKADFKIPASLIEADVTIQLQLVEPTPTTQYTLKFTSATCELKNEKDEKITEVKLDKDTVVNYHIDPLPNHVRPQKSQLSLKIPGTTDDFTGEYSYSQEDGHLTIKMVSSVLITIQGEESIQIHYHRTDNNYEGWKLWLWEYPSGGGADYEFNGTDDYGVFAAYPLSYWPNLHNTNALGFIVKKGDWEEKDPDMDRVVKFNRLEIGSQETYHIYLETNNPNIYIDSNHTLLDDVEKCEFADFSNIQIKTITDFVAYKVFEDNQCIADERCESSKEQNYKLKQEVTIEKNYRIEINFESGQTISQTISKNKLFGTQEFSDQYNYDGDLGAIYTSSKTTFKVWSPVSKAITLKIYDNGTPKSVSATLGSDVVYKTVTMNKGEKGVFSAEINEDLAGKYYTYTVTNDTYTEKEIVDPYAKSCGVNGLRGMIVDFSKTNPGGFENITPHNIDRKAMTVYETHIADLTSDEEHWTSDEQIKKKAKTFEGFMVSGTTYTSGNTTVKTGFDHIKELGVNAVQILPFFDHDNDEVHPTFNWGYNPLNYNCLDGIYSLDPYNGYTRITEFKNLVKAYHDAGINIIMDVVYNHVSNAIGSNFDTLMPGYYYRYTDSGYLSNGSGCGNETRSELYMMRKFMVDSTCFWAKEYKLGGFRFDLMGLHDLTTMDTIVEETKKINSSIVIYGEPWQGGTSTLGSDQAATQANINNFKGFGAFNDQMRDALIKGGLCSDSDTGWVTESYEQVNQSDIDKITAGILGKTKTDSLECNDPNKAVNYVTCHDNYTLFDRLGALCKSHGEEIYYPTAIKMATLANSVVFTSCGTTFMLAGEEFMRTKYGDKNSYNSGYYVNRLNYALKVENINMFNNYKKLIQFKQEQDFLHKDSPQFNVMVSNNKNMIKYTATDDNGKEYVVIHTNGYSPDSLEAQNLDGYTLYLDTIDPNKQLTSSTSLSAYETLIAYK